MTDVYTDTEYSATTLAVLAERRGFVIRKMPLKFGTGGLKMSELTLDEAIKHCEEVAKRNGIMAKFRPRMDYYADELVSREDCLKRASEYRQLAEWLKELKNRREVSEIEKRSIEKCDKCSDILDCPLYYPWLKE